ncbi:thiolase family protein [Pigmentiphaga soli]|uniref:Thiolase family protein n=1 Tax=Pigmentiphaga soli TaxID=1007095 RepID=A0ABP8GMF2_9BURK
MDSTGAPKMEFATWPRRRIIDTRIAVIGVGNTPYGRLPDYDSTALGAWAFHEALADAGLTAAAIDGLVMHRVGNYQKLCEMTGINPDFVSVQPSNGRMCGVSIQIAVQALMTGQAETIALVYGNDGRSAGAKYGGAADRYDTAAEQMWFPYGMTSPGAVNALMFARHAMQYGTTTEQLAAVSVAFRKHAALNPGAVMRTPITVADHQASRFICEPFRLLDYCQINDGGVAMILTRSGLARDLRHPPVYVRGVAQASSLAEGLVSDDFNRAPMQSVARKVYAMADVDRDDLDALMIYDNFTATVLFGLEGFGFCGVGEGGAFVQDGRLELGGALPTNTSGGHLSESYMQGWNLNAEAVRQIRGGCGERQVAGARLIQYIAPGPVTTSVIYGSEPV